MKLLRLLLISMACLVQTMAKAQDWSLLGGNSKFILSARDSIGPEKGTRFFIHEVSAATPTTDGINYAFKKFYMLRTLINGCCYESEGVPSFLGKSLKYKPESGNIIIQVGYGYDSVLINLRKEVGQEALSFNDGAFTVKGKVTRKYQSFINGQVDSLKTIRLHVSNPFYSRNLIIGDSLVVSKSTGLISFFDLGQFPTKTLYLTREWITSDTLAQWFKKVDDGELYPGDVFHVKSRFVSKSTVQPMNKYDEYEIRVDSVFPLQLKIHVTRNYPSVPAAFYAANLCIANGSTLVQDSCFANRSSEYLPNNELFKTYDTPFAPDTLRETTGAFPSAFSYALFKGDNGIAYRISKKYSAFANIGSICPGLGFTNFDLKIIGDDTPTDPHIKTNLQVPVYFYSPSRNLAIGTPIPGFTIFLSQAKNERQPKINVQNPVFDQLHFFGLQGTAEITLFNCHGQTVLKEQICSSNKQLNIAKIFPGIYQYCINDGKGGIFSGKILKE